MLRIAIVDDEGIFAAHMQQKIISLLQEKKISCQILIYTNAHRFLQVHRSTPFDLIYLDIEMPQMTGIELAAEIRKSGGDVHLIFVSSHSNFVFDTFQYAPFRFIRKEKLLGELAESLNAYCDAVYQKKMYLTLQLEDNAMYTVDMTKILYFYALRHDQYFVQYPNLSKRLANRIYTMENLEEEMKAHGFIRIHKTYLVNFLYIYQIHEKSVTLISIDGKKGEELPMSYRRLNEVKEQYQLLTRGGDAL